MAVIRQRWDTSSLSTFIRPEWSRFKGVWSGCLESCAHCRIFGVILCIKSQWKKEANNQEQKKKKRKWKETKADQNKNQRKGECEIESDGQTGARHRWECNNFENEGWRQEYSSNAYSIGKNRERNQIRGVLVVEESDRLNGLEMW